MINQCQHCKGKCCRDIDFGYRVVHMGAQCYMHECDYCDDGTEVKPSSDPKLDGTDLAHPAWWRGNDAGLDGAVYQINKILDLIEAGEEHNGKFNSQKLNMLRDRLYQMYRK